MNARRHLPKRRVNTSFTFYCAGLRYTATASLFPDRGIAEFFLNNHKSNSAADTNAGDSAITLSLAVQHGPDPEVIRKALGRDGQGRATGPLGVALDLLLAGEIAS